MVTGPGSWLAAGALMSAGLLLLEATAAAQPCRLSADCASEGLCSAEDRECQAQQERSDPARSGSTEPSASPTDSSADDEFDNPELMYTGITFIAAGAGIVVLGASLFIPNVCPGGGCTKGQTAAAAGFWLMPIGTAFTLAGLPMTIVGAQDPSDETPDGEASVEVDALVSPTYLGVRGRF